MCRHVQLAAILIATLANIILRMIRSSKKQISFNIKIIKLVNYKTHYQL